jgi:hypothetical protein
MFRPLFRLAPLWLSLALACGADAADPMPTAFTYQGELRNNGAPVNGTLQVFITPYAEAQGGAPLAATVEVDGVPAVDGLFSLPIDFGPGFFVGDDVWLEIGMRVNGGDQQLLSPRQQVTPAPYALKVRLNSVTGLEIQDGEVGAADLAAGSVVAGKIATDAVTAVSIAGGAVATDELANAAVTTIKLADSAVTSAKVADATLTAADLADGSVATAELAIASVTSSRLADGAVGSTQLADASVTGTQVADSSLGTADFADSAVTTPDLANASVTAPKLADGAVTATKIAIGAVGAAQVNLSQVQARLTANCPPGMSLRGIGSGGTAICNNALSYPVSDGVYGRGGLALRADGRPVYTGLDLSTGELRFGQCLDTACEATSYTVLDTPAGLGEWSAVAIRSDGRPVIAYGISVSGIAQVRLRVCNQPSCLTSAIVPVDTSGAYGGGGVSLALRADGVPLVGFQTAPDDMRLYICSDPACSSGQSRLIEAAGSTGHYPAVIWRANGNPMASYLNTTNGEARLYLCNGGDCASGTTRILGTSAALGSTRIVERSDGRPLMAWHQVSGGGVAPRLYDCADADCSAGNTVQLPALSGGSAAASLGLTLRANGNPILAYGRNGRATTFLHLCSNAGCSAGMTVEPLHPASYGGGIGLALALRADERPVLLLDAGLTGTGHLLAICGNTDCSSAP